MSITSKTEREIEKFGRLISEDFPKLAIDSDIGKRALESFYKLRQKGILTNRWQIKDALSCLYFETKKHFPHSPLSNLSDPRIAENFCQFVRLNFDQECRPLPNQKTLMRTYRIIVREQWQNLPALVREICQNMKLDKKISDGAIELAEQMQKKQIQSQRDPFFLTAGLIYVAARWVEGRRKGSKFTLNRLATQFITNPTTISQAARYVLDKTNPIVLLNQQKLFPHRPPVKYFTRGFLLRNLFFIKNLCYFKGRMRFQELATKKILILGLGKEGRDNLNFLRKIFPHKILGIADRLKLKELSDKAKKMIRLDKKLKLHLGNDYLRALKNYDVIIKSPGISPKTIAPFITKKQRITSQTEVFFENCPGKIVGITATKGKSTTTSLIYKVLKEGGIRAHLVGNIGRPVLQLLFSATEKDVYVYELSSHQLFNLKKSPYVAVFLNVFPEHLDYYRGFKEYIKAKTNITRYQKERDYLVFNLKNEIVKKIAKISKAQKKDLNSVKIKKIISLKDIPLKGEFNLQNVKAAILVGKIFEVPDKKIARAIKNFKPLPHRLELVGTFRGITFYNDALATIPESTIKAIEAFDGNVQTIILGGFDRGLDFKKLAKKVLESRIKTIILFPTTGERIWKEILKQAQSKSSKLPKHFFVDSMPEAVRLCYRETKKDGVCLLSTASPSFSIFRDYKEKGNLFKKYVKKYVR